MAHRPVWIAITVVAVMAAALGGSLWATGGSEKQAASAAAACPASYVEKAPWVPVQHTRIDRHARLTPQNIPTAALMCAYAGDNTYDKQSGWKLSRQRALRAGFDRLGAELAWQPRRRTDQSIACTTAGGKQTNYLLRLSYPDGTGMWVSVTDEVNSCVDSSNGDFVSWGSVGLNATRAFRSGQWPKPAAATCQAAHVGRLGQETTMVPPGSTSVTICTEDGPGRTYTSGYGDLVAALNGLPTTLSTRGCGPSPEGPDAFHRLIFSYPQGPGVSISILTGCLPEVDNLSLQSHSAKTILPLLRR